jgi:hypothetical protein
MYSTPITTSPPAVCTENASTLSVTVLFTDVPHTLAALRHAGALSCSLHAWLRIVVPVVVPDPLDLTSSPSASKVVCRRLTTVVQGFGIPTLVNVVYCRDREEPVKKSLDKHSIVVICWRKKWIFDPMRGLARRLTKLGHQVVVVRSE